MPRFGARSSLHHCPICHSYSKSAAVVARHYRKYHKEGGSYFGTWPTAASKYVDPIRDLDKEEDVEKVFAELARRSISRDPQDVAAEAVFRRARRGKTAVRRLRDQGVSRRRAAEILYLVRLAENDGDK